MAGIISGALVGGIAIATRKKPSQPLEKNITPIRRTLRNLDAVGGSGFLMPKAHMANFLNTETPWSFRRDLAHALGVSEADLVNEMTSFMREGGTVFACLALIDMYLAD